MDCRQYVELISEAIDNRLSAEMAGAFAAHGRICKSCAGEYELERMGKQVIARRLRRVNVPGGLYYQIVRQTVQAPAPRLGWLSAFFGDAVVNPATAFLVLVVASFGAAGLLQHNNARPLRSEHNVIDQSANTYQAVLTGYIKPTVVSRQADEVRAYLMKDVSFDVNILPLDDCDWCGGSLSNESGTKVAHVVYKFGGRGLLYVYQANYDEVMKGRHLTLPENAKAALRKTGWYFQRSPSNANIILWKHNNTLCAAVSAMDKESMMALLTQTDP